MSSPLRILTPKIDQPQQGVDFVFVHGLNPLSHDDHAERTWTHADGTLWPRDLLPMHVPTARVMLFAYNANVAWDTSEAGIRQHANTLLDLLDSNRQGTLHFRPLIFVCHSLGGLVVKQALLTANLNRQFTFIRQYTRAIVFFGTPHRGGNGATLGQIAVNVARALTSSDRNDLVKSLQKNSTFLAHLTADFKHIYEDFHYLSIVESRGILRAPLRTVVVDKNSAELGLSGHREHVIDLDRDHRQICKLTNDGICERIMRHIIRLTVLAEQSTKDDQLESPVQSAEERQMRHRVNVSAAGSAPLLSTVNFSESVKLIGHENLKTQLTQWLHSDSPSMVVYGDPGSGKTSVVLEFARMQQDRYSVFWFAAESLKSLQAWYMRASFCISPSKFGEFSRDHYRSVTEWLLDPANGKWILIFDSANPELDFRDILPKTPAWGKIVFTSCTQHLMINGKGLSDQVLFIPMPPLSEAEAVMLFKVKSENKDLIQSQEVEVTRLVSSLRHKPLAIILASTHFRTFRTLSGLYPALRDSVETGEDIIWSWTSLLIEDARVEECMLLKFFVLISQDIVFPNIINLCQRSRRRRRSLAAETEYVRTTYASSAIKHWISIELLQQQTSPLGSVLAIPSSVKAAIKRELAGDIEQSERILTMSSLLLALAQPKSNISSSETCTRYIEKTVDSFRNLCVTAADMSIDLPNDIEKYLMLAALHYLGKTVDEGRRLAKGLFWRQWLSSFQYPRPASADNEEHSLFGVPLSHWPIWLKKQLDNEHDTQNIARRNIIRETIVAKLWDALKLAISLSGMGRAWHGVRKHVFDFAWQNSHAHFDESQKASLIDFMDKGGAEGVQIALQKILDANEFQQEALERIDSEVMEDVVRTICSLSDPLISSLPEDAIQQAISKALDDTMSETFAEASGAMAEALFPIRDLITSSIQTTLEVPFDGQRARNLVSFVISEAGSQCIRECCHIMTEGFCEYLEIAKIWIATKSCLHLVSVALYEPSLRRDLEWGWICVIIELIREGIMPIEMARGRMAEVARRRMHYWTEEACNCRVAWGARRDVPDYDFRNQGQWEEISVLMGASDHSWILS